MKAAERKKKRLQEMNKQKNVSKKKLVSVPSEKNYAKIKQDNFGEINNDNIIQNIPASRPANNMDPEKIAERLKQRKERKKKKNMKESNINPVFIDNNKNIDNNIKNNIRFYNNYINDKDSNKLGYSLESMAPLPGGKKVNFNLPIDKKSNNDNIVNKNDNKSSISNSSNSNSNSNSINIPSTTSAPNYQILSKNYSNIKNENIEEFLNKTNPNKPTDERKESEVQRMIEVMNLRPNIKNGNNKTNLNDSDNYAYNLTQKIEGASDDYYNTQKEIKELSETVKEEENKMEQMLQRNREEIQKYIQKIITLQNTLINTKQGDIIALEEANKIDDIQINNLSVTYQRLEEENERERNRMFNLINKEILPLQKELKNEILEVQRLKKELLQWNKKIPPKDILRKIEVVMKYMKHCTK